MSGALRAAAGELDAEELLAALDEGRRVVISTEMLGGEYEVTLRRDRSLYYCDTPTTLHRHDTRDGMRRCIVEQGYVDASGEDGDREH